MLLGLTQERLKLFKSLLVICLHVFDTLDSES
jgi:hypothetical protein